MTAPIFTNCPKCTSPQIHFNGSTRFHCSNCQFEFYKNVAAGVVGIYTLHNRILFQVRNQEPSKDKLDCPGGFLNPGETAEAALSRETYEEIGLKLSKFTYLGTAPNNYYYKGIMYNVCDMIYFSEINEVPGKIDHTEVKEITFVSPEEINDNDLAFKSIKTAVEYYKQWKHR